MQMCNLQVGDILSLPVCCNVAMFDFSSVHMHLIVFHWLNIS